MRRRGMARHSAASMYSLRRSTRAVPRGARVDGPFDDDEGENDVDHALAEEGQDHEGDENGWERELKVDDAHDHALDAPADIGGDQS